MNGRVVNLSGYLQKFKTDILYLIGPFYDGSQISAEPIVYVDRGVQFRKNNAGWSVGDGDSADAELDEFLNPKKDYSDLAYVLRNIPPHYVNIHLCGFLGERRDHEIMNLAEAHSFLKNVANATRVHFDKKVTALSRGTWALEASGSFSLFAFDSVKLALDGNCEYKIKEPTVFRALSSHGLSNSGHGKIEVTCNSPVFIFFNN